MQLTSILAVFDVARVVLAPFILIALVNTVVVWMSHRKFGFCLPITLMGSIVVLYVSQLVTLSFLPGFVLLGIAAVAGAIIFVRRFRELLGRVFPGLAAFAVLYVFFLVVDHGRRLWDFDEFWHWGMMVKETLRLGRFYCDPASNLIIHKDYPPFLALFESLWCWMCGGYTEGRATLALHVLEFSLLVLPLVELVASGEDVASAVDMNGADSAKGETVVKRENPKASMASLVCEALRYALLALAITIALFFVTSLFDHALTLNTILADVPVALLFAYCLFLVVTGECYGTLFGTIALTLGLTTCLMVKQIGLAPFGVSFLLYLLFLVPRWDRKHAIPALLSAFTAAVIPLFVKQTWSWVVRMNNVSDMRAVAGGNGQFDMGKIDLGQFFAAVSGKAEDSLLNETFSHLMHAFIVDDVANLAHGGLSFLLATALVCVGVAVVVWLSRGRLSRADGLRIVGSFAVGYAGFVTMLSVLFLFCFDSVEMQELRGYQRYVDSYLIGEVVLIAMLVMLFGSRRIAERYRSKLSVALPAVVVLCLTVALNPAVLDALHPRRGPTPAIASAEPLAARVSDNLPAGSSLGVFYDSTYAHGVNWSFRTMLQYCANSLSVPDPCDLASYSLETDSEGLQPVWNYALSHDYLLVADDAAINDHLIDAAARGVSDSGLYQVVDGTLVPVE